MLNFECLHCWNLTGVVEFECGESETETETEAETDRNRERDGRTDCLRLAWSEGAKSIVPLYMRAEPSWQAIFLPFPSWRSAASRVFTDL